MKSIQQLHFNVYPDRRIIIQLNTPFNKIEFFTVEDEDHLNGWKENYGDELVAVWRVKSLKTLPRG